MNEFIKQKDGKKKGEMEKREVKVKVIDMEDSMKADAIEIATQAIENAIKEGQEERVVAEKIKKYFDEKYSQYWHCIVGRNFGSHVTHESKCFIQFNYGDITVLLFKAG